MEINQCLDAIVAPEDLNVIIFNMRVMKEMLQSVKRMKPVMKYWQVTWLKSTSGMLKINTEEASL